MGSTSLRSPTVSQWLSTCMRLVHVTELVPTHLQRSTWNQCHRVDGDHINTDTWPRQLACVHPISCSAVRPQREKRRASHGEEFLRCVLVLSHTPCYVRLQACASGDRCDCFDVLSLGGRLERQCFCERTWLLRLSAQQGEAEQLHCLQNTWLPEQESYHVTAWCPSHCLFRTFRIVRNLQNCLESIDTGLGV